MVPHRAHQFAITGILPHPKNLSWLLVYIYSLRRHFDETRPHYFPKYCSSPGRQFRVHETSQPPTRNIFARIPISPIIPTLPKLIRTIFKFANQTWVVSRADSSTKCNTVGKVMETTDEPANMGRVLFGVRWRIDTALATQVFVGGHRTCFYTHTRTPPLSSGQESAVP